MFFIDNYAVKKLSDTLIDGKKVLFHQEKLELLKIMTKDNSVPHIIFYGPPGSGKKSLTNIFLEMLYGPCINNLTEHIYKVNGSGNTTTDEPIMQSNHHIVIEPHNNNFDRYLVQDVVKSYAQRMPIITTETQKTFKTVLIHDVDNLSYYAQTSLRRTMEKYSDTCRFIMCCQSLSKVIDPIRSRCYNFRINAPTNEQLFELLLNVCKKEKLLLSREDHFTILNKAQRNTKKLLWLLQLKACDFTFNTTYDNKIKEITKKIIKHQVSSIKDIRLMLYGIIITNINGSIILKSISDCLMQYVNMNIDHYESKDTNFILNLRKISKFRDEFSMYIIQESARFEHKLVRRRREIIHIEAFIASIIYFICQKIN